METKIYNYDNLLESDINRTVTRVKALIINSKNELLLGYSNGIYQFIGGHIEKDEDLIAGLFREIAEESGIILNIEQLTPFFKMIKYVKDYPKKGDNSCYECYYYSMRTDERPNLKLVNYTDDEKRGDFKLVYVPFDQVEEIFMENENSSERSKTIALENLETIKVYKKHL